MKKLAVLLFVVFIFVAGIYAVLQSEIGKNWIRNLFANALQQSGYEVQIGQIEGTLPHQINLRNVTITGQGLDVAVDTLNLRPVLWRLVRKEIAFNDIRAKGISVSQGSPFDFDGRFRMNKKRAFMRGQISDWTFSGRYHREQRRVRFTAQNRLFDVQGEGLLDSNYHLLSSDIHLESDRLVSQLPFEASGQFLADVLLTAAEKGYQAKVHWQIPHFTVESNSIGLVEGKGEAKLIDRTLEGEFLIEPYAKTAFNLTLSSDGLLVGTNTIDINNLQALHLPHIYGELQGRAEWHSVDGVQGLHLDGTATNFYYDTFFAQKASLYSDLLDPFHNLTGLIDIEAQKGKWKELELETATLEFARGTESWPFKLFAEGEWKHPLELRMQGFWKEASSLDIQSFTGTFYNHPFFLQSPVQLEWTDTVFRLPDVEISLGDATLFAHIDRNNDRTDARLRAKGLPLDFLSLNPLDVPIGGLLNLEADIREQKNRLSGHLQATVEQTQPLPATGTFKGDFNRDLLKLDGEVLVNNQPLVHLDLSLPIHFSLWPFEADLLTHKRAKGHLSFNGQLEEVLDFFDLGPHRLEGLCHCDLRFSNTLARPLVEGYLTLEDGFYENYYTGAQLNNIYVDLLAEKNIVYLRSLNAQNDTLIANGEIRLVQADLYPFRLDATFNNFDFAQIDLVTATANGKIHIEGNATAALAKGDVQIVKSELTIPDHIPRPLPDLQVTYIHSTRPTPPPETQYQPYPLHLDLRVAAPTVAIAGRGVTSEWKGDFHLGGTLTSPAAQGKLELVSGEFNFSSRSFRLTEGSLSLSGREHEMPYLNLAATTETKGILITARLQGPLDDPQITLQSNPPLPLGSIMSHLLFGQDMSEISSFQALQLATSLASMAGTGSDIMESTRRSLGIDRLRVITDPTEEGGETVALQVGKYVAKGVLVSFTQGTEDNGPKISVEVELRGNLVFQVESDEHQEQGKFTLKWSKHY